MASATDSDGSSTGDDDAQLEQLAANTLTTPEWVVPGHGSDEVANLGAQARPPQPGP